MKKELIQINTDALIKAYKELSNDCKNTLESLFGEKIFKSKDITERIKTFEDACNELGVEHPFVRSYNLWKNYGEYNQPDADAYFKLRIIVAALMRAGSHNLQRKKSDTPLASCHILKKK